MILFLETELQRAPNGGDAGVRRTPRVLSSRSPRTGREKLRGIRSVHKKPFLGALRRREVTKGPITPGHSWKRALAPNADILARDPHLIIE